MEHILQSNSATVRQDSPECQLVIVEFDNIDDQALVASPGDKDVPLESRFNQGGRSRGKSRIKDTSWSSKNKKRAQHQIKNDVIDNSELE